MSIDRHRLVKRPQRKACGIVSPKPQPLTLQSQPKRFTADGEHRSFSPEETLQKYAHHISPIAGVIDKLVKLPNDHNFIHVYTANYLDFQKKHSLVDPRKHSIASSAGKGKTDAQSQASCVCEALERYSGVFTGDEYRITGTYTQLEPMAIHPDELTHYRTHLGSF